MKRLVGIILLMAGVGVVPASGQVKTLREGPCFFSEDPKQAQVNDARCYAVTEIQFKSVPGSFVGEGIVPGGPPPPPPSGQNPPPPAPGPYSPPYQPPYSYPGSGGTGIDLGMIINYFERIWNILEKTRPVVKLDRPPYAAALPQGVSDWTQMEWPSDPKGLLFHFSAKNYFNIEVGRFDYVISYIFDGRYQGKGHYLMNITIYAKNENAKPGFVLDANVEIPAVYNAGTTEDPTAAAQILVSARLKSLMTDMSQTRSYVVKGDGKYSETVPIGFGKFTPKNWM